jgi:diguanylate cyclase (GGDEF)-like protein
MLRNCAPDCAADMLPRMIRGLLLLCALLSVGTARAAADGWVLAGEWSVPPPEVADALARDRDPDTLHRAVHWYLLETGGAGPAAQVLRLHRDRGNRVWLFDNGGRRLAAAALGSLRPDGEPGGRGLVLLLAAPQPGEHRRWLAVEATLGSFGAPRIVALERHLAGERATWAFDAGLGSVIAALALLSLAFLVSLRDRTYLAYAWYLIVLLLAMALRHPLVFRFAADLGMVPERVAAVGTLSTALAAWGAVELMCVGSGLLRAQPRGVRLLRGLAVLAVVLGVVDVATIVAHPAIAHVCFTVINALFAGLAVVSAAMLVRASLRGGRMPRYFLAGWALLVGCGIWFTLGPAFGLPQPADPQRFVLAACALQGLVWAAALADRALGLQRERDHAQALAENDPLTGLANRRVLDEQLATRARGVLLLCDLDRFKAINDRFGHAAGDQCLRHFARVFQQALDGHGVCGRYGGEEFLAVLDGHGLDSGFALAEQLRAEVERSPVDVQGVRLVLTVSTGVARLGPAGPAAALAAADRALYRAKDRGRNRVESADD